MTTTVLMVQNVYIKWLACRSDHSGSKTDPQAKAKGISILLVDAALDGVKRPFITKIGLHAQDTAELFLMMSVCLQLSVWVKKDKVLLI